MKINLTSRGFAAHRTGSQLYHVDRFRKFRRTRITANRRSCVHYGRVQLGDLERFHRAWNEQICRPPCGAQRNEAQGCLTHSYRARRVATMSDKRYSKVEEEIIQILDQMDRESPPTPPANLVPFRPRTKPSPRRINTDRLRATGVSALARLRRYSSGSWVGVGVVAAVFAWQLSRFSGVLAMVAVVLSGLAFLAALYTRRGGGAIGLPPSAPTTKRWRGRDIDFDGARRSSVADRTRNWGRKRKDPRR